MAMLKSFLLLCMIFSMGNAGGCPYGWTQFSQRCYKYFSHVTKWIIAERNCQSLGGNLASVHNKLENDFLLSLLSSSIYYSWIGAHDAVHERQWLWSDGTKFFYTNWCPGKPDNLRGSDCSEINYSSERCWNNVPCSYSRAYICVKNM